MIDGYRRAAWHYGHQILGDGLAPFSDLVQRLGTAIVTEADAKLFGDFLVAVHNAGYNLAMDQYRDNLRKLGYKVQVTDRPAEESRNLVRI